MLYEVVVANRPVYKTKKGQKVLRGTKPITMVVSFTEDFVKVENTSDWSDNRLITTCIIHTKGRTDYYYGNTVCSLHDSLNDNKAQQVAFKRALYQRWLAVHSHKFCSPDCESAKDHFKSMEKHWRWCLFNTKEGISYNVPSASYDGGDA